MNQNIFKIISTFSDAIHNAGSSFLASQLGPNERPVTADEIEMVRLMRQERERTTRPVAGGRQNPEERRTSPRYVPPASVRMSQLDGASGFDTPPRPLPLPPTNPFNPAWLFQEDDQSYRTPPEDDQDRISVEKRKNL